MEPLGTITKYYPFIDEESKSILDSLMDEASSYYDFVLRLCNVVIENEAPVNLAYLAAVQAWWCRIEDKKSLIQEKYKDVSCIRPWAFPHNSVEKDQVENHDSVVEAIEKAIDASMEDWMETELHLLHTFYHWPLGELSSYYESLEKAKCLTDSNPHLNCFDSLICAFKGLARAREEMVKDSLKILQRGKELAEMHDDSLYKYMNMLQEGNILKPNNVQDTLALFEDLYDLAQELEVPYFIGEILNDSANVYETAGEYDLAISCHHEKMKAFGMEEVPDPFPSRIYSTMGDGQKALLVISRYLEYVEPIETIVVQLLKAWALALTDRLDDAERTLESAYSLIMKTGSERNLGNYYHISGVIELRKGNFLNAIGTIEKAWGIAERTPSGTNQNRALLDLARAEILLDNQSIDSTKVATPGKWLCKLEDFAVQCELPGIRMLAALLKSEFYQNHGLLKDAHATLLDALNITDSLGVQTLRKRISDRILELDRLLPDEEMVS